MKQTGLTLVELLTTLAVATILLGIGIPGYGYLVNQSGLASTTNNLVSALMYMRSEAIKRGVRVSACKSSLANVSQPTCDAGAEWENGWLVFIDGATLGTVDPGDQILHIHQPSANGANIDAVNFTTYISYLPSGFSQGPNHLGTGSFLVCVGAGKRKLIINQTGRIRLDANPGGVCT